MRQVSFLCAAACLLVAGCGSLAPQTVAARKIAEALPQAIGPAARYDVTVDGDPFALARGRARHVHINGQDVQITPAVTLDALTLDADDVSFDTQAHRVSHVGQVTFNAAIGQAHLNSYLAQRRPDVTVTLEQTDLQARLPVAAGPLHTIIGVAGTLTPSEPGASTLDFVADRARLGFLPVPAFVVNATLSELNPLVDLSTVRVPLALQSAQVAQGRLVLRGTAQFAASNP